MLDRLHVATISYTLNLIHNQTLTLLLTHYLWLTIPSLLSTAYCCYREGVPLLCFKSLCTIAYKFCFVKSSLGSMLMKLPCYCLCLSSAVHSLLVTSRTWLYSCLYKDKVAALSDLTIRVLLMSLLGCGRSTQLGLLTVYSQSEFQRR